MRRNKEILKIVLLLIGTVAITFSGLNWHNGIAAWIAPIFLLMYSRKAKWRQMLIFFIVMCVSGSISQTGNNLMNLPSVNVYNGLSFGILISIPYAVDKLLYKKNERFYYSLIFPSLVMFVEFVASMAIGIWGSIAHTQYEFKSFMQLSSLTGIYGIWFMISWFAAVVNWIIENKDNRRTIYKGALIFGSIFLLILIVGQIRIKSLVPTDKNVKVSAVLSDLDILQIIEEEANTFKDLAENNNVKIPAQLFSDSVTIKKLVNRTSNTARQGAKIIAWNESALIISQEQKKNLISEIQSICSKNEAYVLVAFLEECGEQNKKPFNNRSILISPTGEVIWEYKKSFLHPTAETPIINKGNFELPVVETPYGKIGNVICADLDIQNYIKQAGEKEVDILLVPAFDWEGITPLHPQMANLQAIQFGFSLVRSNGKGLTEVNDYMGNNPASLNTLTSDDKILYADVPIKSVKTLYSKTGDLFVYLAVLFLVFIIIKTITMRKINSRQ